MMRRRSAAKGAVLGLAASLTLAGCLGGSGGGGTTGGTANSVAPATSADPNALRGQKVDIFGAFTGDEAKAFNTALADFKSRTGIDVTYTGANDFATLIRTRVRGNNAPDIALFPQPGGLTDIAKSGKVTPIDQYLDVNSLQQSLIPGILDSAKGSDGKVYGAPMRLAVKSLLWYPEPAFKNAGYTAPKTNDELLALTDKIRSSGKTPWCIGIGAGAATGWYATDWIEEYVLRVGGPDFYDKWVKHEVPFTDPTVKQAAELFGKIALTDGNVAGGRKGIVNTRVEDAPDPMFDNPPKCWLHRQGNFVLSSGFFPSSVLKNPSAKVGLSVFPPTTAGQQPILGGGDLAGLLKPQNAAAVETMKFITSKDFGGPWAKAGGWLSPHKTFDASQYPDDITRQIATIASQATVFRFDGSDLMPAAVGSGTFWTGMVDWISGDKDLDTVLKDIDQSFPDTSS